MNQLILVVCSHFMGATNVQTQEKHVYMHTHTNNLCSGQGHVYHHKFHQNENRGLRGCVISKIHLRSAVRERLRDREGEGKQT